MTTETSGRRETAALVAGSLLAAVLYYAGGRFFLWRAVGHPDPGSGPTAQTLDEAFSALGGAVLGLGLGVLLFTAVRRGSGIGRGICAGMLGCCIVLAWLLVTGRLGRDDLSVAATLLVPAAIVSLAGAALGKVLGDLIRALRRRALA